MSNTVAELDEQNKASSVTTVPNWEHPGYVTDNAPGAEITSLSPASVNLDLVSSAGTQHYNIEDAKAQMKI